MDEQATEGTNAGGAASSSTCVVTERWVDRTAVVAVAGVVDMLASSLTRAIFFSALIIIAAFIPNETVWGFANLQGLVMFGLYAAGIVSALVVSLLIRKVFWRGAVALAAYRRHATPPGPTVVILSGGNIEPRLLAKTLTPAEYQSGLL